MAAIVGAAGAKAAEVRPYGEWASPITAESLAEGAIGVSELRVADGRLYWLESRPAEGGRLVLMTGDETAQTQLTPAHFNVRTRVHEYGGAAYVVDGPRVLFSNFRDQRLYSQAGDAAPEALTPDGYRYADCVPAPAGGLVCVREDHTDPKDVKNAVVALSLKSGDAGTVLFGSSDFVAYPRISRDGRRLAFMAWDHPNMPWDTTTLYVADLTPAGLSDLKAVAGGHDESVMEPQWGADGTLYFISDRTGFWNLYAEKDGEVRPLAPKNAEFAGPLWGLGQANYVLMDDGRIVASYRDAERDHLVVIEPGNGAVRELPVPFLEHGALHRLDAARIAMIGGSADQTGAVFTVDVDSGETRLVRRPSPAAIDPKYVSHAQAISFPTAGGRTAHALYYPPANGDFRAPDGTAPPLIVQAHGGPTGQASAAFSLSNQFWTSRGFALVDVDYGGSSGYGRAYRQTLNGQWGVVDVEDVIAAAKYLTSTGRADPARVAIHGGSAGGFTVLAALSQSDVFKAGGDFYGVSDLEALARDTHKFESRYLDNLVGPWPAAKATYEARSPIHHLEGFRSPLIIFQGSEDPIVPPNQAHMILKALRERQQPVAYMEFAGEGHGFRKAENIIAAKEAELYFYGQVFGFRPADKLPEVRIENLPKR
ncbi:MAG TPA: prolyl oligopeptidase family serine peptidase [Caulobacteraceae bacterium]|nr:prolyl oligopeptidase family serine peptidase [Caulobacteraceae bacterium]